MSLFSTPTYKKYSDIISFVDEKEAKKSVKKLRAEYKSAKTTTKKLRIERVAVFAANRANASAARKNLSKKEKIELKNISKIYRKFYESV